MTIQTFQNIISFGMDLAMRLVFWICFLIWEIKQKITLMENNRLINPVFLVCSERSGSNLIRSIFDTHKNFLRANATAFNAVYFEIQ